jgi:prepilin-type N-terminal cleavage/methylation domain-containing protein
MKAARHSQGFTLLEVLVATAIMAIAIVGLLSALTTSMRNAARLTDHDRMAMLARTKMDELLVDYSLPFEGGFQAAFPPAQTGGKECGFQVETGIFEAPPNVVPGSAVLQRIGLRVWWGTGEEQRSLVLSGFRRNVIPLNQFHQ